MHQFWKELWARKQAIKIITFQWLLAHRALPVGEWMCKIGQQVNCPNCGHTVETLHRIFWDCGYAMQVWKRIIRILERKGERLSLTWGMAAWSSLSKDIEGYDSPSVTYKLLIENGASTMIPQQRDIWLEPSKRFTCYGNNLVVLLCGYYGNSEM